MKSSRTIIARLAGGACLSALAFWPHVAFAQEQADSDKKVDVDEPEIVVTGTLIRGTEAVGAQTITLNPEAIVQQGAASTNQILGLVPQISNAFNGRFEVEPRGVTGGQSINRPNLRRLPGINSASGGTTLVLVDGFRIAPVGVNQAAIDVDIIPGAVLSGVDVLTDGGTSLYGADAVAGVINFRTMKTFDGLKMDANYGLGDTLSGYSEYDAAITAGTSWNGGNAYLSFSYSDREEILNREAPWASGVTFDANGNPTFGGAQCPNPVGQTRTFRYVASFRVWTDNPAAGGGLRPVGTPCDDFSDQSYLPAQKRYSVFGSFTQQLDSNVEMRITGYFTKRDTSLSIFPLGFTTRPQTPVFPANPVNGQSITFDAGTSFSFSPNSAYVNRDAEVGFETYGITPEFTISLPADFQLRTTTHFGRSTNYQRFPGVDIVLAQALVDSGALRPTNVAAASADVINRVTNFETAQDTVHEIIVARSVIDGPLFKVPGGDVRIAIGSEYQKNLVKTRILSGAINAIDTTPFRSASRDSISFFAEINAPVFEFLELTASVRYDDYSDFGSTTNPNVGFSFTPTDWLKIYGHWNTSFNAPTALDLLAQGIGRFTTPIYTPTNGPEDPFKKWNGQGTRSLILDGARAGLQPQEAENFAIGVEFTPAYNLRFGGMYYRLDFTNILGAVNPADRTTFRTNPEFYFYSPTDALFRQFLSELANGDVLAQQIRADEIALVVDRRTANLSSAVIEGFDFNASYILPTDIGDFSLSVNGNVPTKLTLETSGNVVDTLPQAPDFTASFVGTFSTGGFSSRVTVNYTGPIKDNGTDFRGAVVSVPSFVQTNLFLGYKFGENSGFLEGTSLRLIVDNIFEEEPTRVQRGDRNALSYVNFTLGRVFKFGISKEF